MVSWVAPVLAVKGGKSSSVWRLMLFDGFFESRKARHRACVFPGTAEGPPVKGTYAALCV